MVVAVCVCLKVVLFYINSLFSSVYWVATPVATFVYISVI